MITIIALLAAFSLPQMNRMRANARDTQRIADLHTIQVALTMYYATYGHYPIVTQGTTNWATSEPTSYDDGIRWSQLQTDLSPYLAGGSLPHDPLGTGSNGPFYDDNFHYAYSCSYGQIYDLVCQLEGKNHEQTCQYKCWRYHTTSTPETPWCNVCSGGYSTSKYLYADH